MYFPRNSRRIVNGRVISKKRIYNELLERDDDGIFTKFIEYFDDKETKFIEVTLADKDMNTDYKKAIYKRFDNITNRVIETVNVELIYINNTLVDVKDYYINNDFYSNNDFESILDNIINRSRLSKSIADIQNGSSIRFTKLLYSTDIFKDITESRTITIEDFGKILRNSTSDDITLTIPEDVDFGIDISDFALSLSVFKYSTGNITITGSGDVVIHSEDGNIVDGRFQNSIIVRINNNEWLLR